MKHDYQGNGHEYAALVDGWPCARIVCVEFEEEADFVVALTDGTLTTVTDDRSTYERCGEAKDTHDS